MQIVLSKGSVGSGDFGHSGRPGQVGGSEGKGGTSRRTSEHHPSTYNGLSKKAAYIMEETGVDEQHAKAYAKAITDFTGIDYTEIRQVGSGTYKGDNKEEEDRLVNHAKNLEALIKKLPKWKSGAIYRGIRIEPSNLQSLRDSHKSGDSIDMLGVSSWSSSEKVALSFGSKGPKAYGHHGSVMLILEKGSMHGASIRSISEFKEEEEVLMSAGSRFKISRIDDVAGTTSSGTAATHTMIYLKEVKSIKPKFSKSIFLGLGRILSKRGADMLLVLRKGGPGSGDFNHAGRPGEVGGSQETRGRVGVTHRYGKEGHKGYEVSKSEKIDYFKGLGVSDEAADHYASAITSFSGSGSSGIRSVQTKKMDPNNYTYQEYYKRSVDIEKALKVMPKWAGTAPLYRGISVNDELLDKLIKSTGSNLIIDMRGTSSWSSSKSTANGFSGHGSGGNSCIFTLEGGSKYAASIKHLSSHSGEDEVLMSMEARYTIVGYKKKDGKHHFTVKQKTKYAEVNLDEVENLPEKKAPKLTPEQKADKEKWKVKQAAYKSIMKDYDNNKSSHTDTKRKLAELLSGKEYGSKAYDKYYSMGMSSMKEAADSLYAEYVPNKSKGTKQPKITVTTSQKTKTVESVISSPKTTKGSSTILEQMKDELTQGFIDKIKKDHPYKYDNQTLETASLSQLGKWAGEWSNYANTSEEHVGFILKSKLAEKVLTHPGNKVSAESLNSKPIMEIINYAKKLGPSSVNNEGFDPHSNLVTKILAHPDNEYSKKQLEDAETDTLETIHYNLEH